MGEVKNLSRQEANSKIKELAGKADTCLFITMLTKLPLTTRPMSTRDVDDDGCLWFFSRKDSNKNREIAIDNRVRLFYSNFPSSEYMCLYGKASVIADSKKAKEPW